MLSCCIKEKIYKIPRKILYLINKNLVLRRGAFFIWKYLNNFNSDIRITIMNYAFRRARLVIVDKIQQE